MTGNRPVIIWLISGCLLIFIMVIIGGITRLTHSGLSMSTWSLIGGAIPPLNTSEWIDAFNIYKTTPEFLKINSHFTLSDFKSIFFWEYLHRLIGRFLGLVFIIPFVYFLIKKKLSKKLIKQSLILFSLGGLQGGIGWWMVKSGLVNRPDVSHYRLAVHLITAFLTCAYTFWVALPLIITNKQTENYKLFRLNLTLLILVVIQIVYGAFVAGLDAGRGFNTWPKMGDKWIADSVCQLEPFWRNFIEAPYGIQFIHRTLAMIIVGFILYLWFYSRKVKINDLQKKSLNLLLGVVVFQTLLGIFTLVLLVPISLALAHQIGAFFLLISVVFSLFLFRRP